ncbi:head GIN domain-containing protein [Mucilaginibacter sp. dw_454]|uniref:head GIN domain-containing protein n=1 Tax=Mucilaginibacter sp. dw_454 TaxID=2720079 RepID=UPI001BD40F82|nr:head GIN domain-containing protein [Mucilaginibacter sp. dw_454]
MKTIKIFIALLLFIGVGQTYAANIEDRHLSGFHAIDESGSFDVYITQGNTESVKVEAPADVIKEVLTDVRGGTLNIHSKNHVMSGWHNIFNNKKVVIYVTVKNIDGITVTGSGDIYFKEGLNAENIRLKVTGSGDVQGKLNAKNLSASITGSGDVKLSGRADNQDVDISGSGDYTARDFTVNNTKISITGSGDASVIANSSLAAHVSGSGDIHYGGNPKNISKNKSGSGDIERF